MRDARPAEDDSAATIEAAKASYEFTPVTLRAERPPLACVFGDMKAGSL